MSHLTRRQVFTITRATCLVVSPIASPVVSDHERALIRSVAVRFLKTGVRAHVTDLEWPVIQDALDAMERALKASLGASPNTVAEDAAGVRAGSSQPAA